MNNSINNNININTEVIGLDIGSSYVKAVSLNDDNTIREKYLQKTGYDYSVAVSSLLGRFQNKTDRFVMGVTGYGRNHWDGVVRKTEISALARALNFLGIYSGTLVDIGGQDNKVLRIKEGRLHEHSLNRRCAAGTGSYLEYIAFRLGIETSKMDELAAWEGKFPVYHTLNSYCTVFAGTEILDCISQNVPLPHLIRGLYVSIVERIREMAQLESPVYLSGGVIAHHPVLAGIFSAILGIDVRVVPNPQFLAAAGIALFARENKS